jgi:LacI family repressor for deo operon, udp, cdd, tsx, nupC, and nupG
MASLRDVAAHAGVSVATASRVLNNAEIVTPKTREKVEKAMQELLFSVAEPSQPEKLAGLFVPDIVNPIFTQITQAIEIKARDAGWAIVLCTTGDLASAEREHAQGFFTRQITNLIFISSVAANTAEHLPHYKALIEHGARLLFINGAPNDLAAPAIGDDEWAAGRISAQHILDLGHRSVGFITGVETTSSRSNLRLSGIQEVASTVPAAVIYPIHSDWGVEGGVVGAARLLEAHPEITALICASDLTALGAMNYCQSQGISVPEDISILGSDGIELGRWVFPSLSTVAQPIAAISDYVASWLTAEETAPTDSAATPDIAFRPTLIVRNSTARKKNS